MTRVLIRGGVAATSLGLLGLLAGCEAQRTRDPRPNVILISIDSLNQRQFEAALDGGYAPTLAALVEHSLRFSRAYTHAPWTTPSHMSMLTGLYPSQHGRDIPWREMLLTNDQYDRVPQFPSLPELLKDAGYDTLAFVGKGSISARFGIGRGFRRFEESAKNHEQTDLPGTLDAFSSWLAGGVNSPFFVFLHTYDFHDPLPTEAPDDSAALRYIDGYLGRVFAELKRRALYDSALIFLTSDHGSRMIRTREKCSVHGAGHYEENLKVPLLLKVPGSAQAGQSDLLVRHVDIVPTVVEALGLPGDSYDGPGVSILSVVRSGEAPRYSFSQADGRCALRHALVTDRYKYIYTPRTDRQTHLRGMRGFNDASCPPACATLPRLEEWYDLADDPFEEHELVQGPLDPARRRVLEEFRRAMREHLALPPRYVREESSGDGGELDPTLREALRSLGYLE